MGTNPFLAQVEPQVDPSEQAPLPEDAVVGPALEVRGPQSPSVEPAPLPKTSAIEVARLHDVGRVVVVGAHGGAGAGTIAQLLGDGAIDHGVRWPQAAGFTRPLVQASVVLVARTTAQGLLRAETIAGAWNRGELGQTELLGIVVIDDGPRLTKEQIRRTKALLRMTPRGWHLRWIEQWRHQLDTDIHLTGRREKRTIAKILTATKPPPTRPQTTQTS